jgi:nucleotide-binding universal stress UspA family protein
MSGEATMSSLRTILVPHDFSPQSDAAFSMAEQLSELSGACLHLLHVVHAPMLHALTPTGPLDLALPEVVLTGARLEADELLNRIAADSQQKVEVHVIEGLPTDAISTLAEEIRADLIVMGTHGREGLTHFLLGSVAERTLRRAPCPVLTVRGAPAAARA